MLLGALFSCQVVAALITQGSYVKCGAFMYEDTVVQVTRQKHCLDVIQALRFFLQSLLQTVEPNSHTVEPSGIACTEYTHIYVVCILSIRFRLQLSTFPSQVRF